MRQRLPIAMVSAIASRRFIRLNICGVYETYADMAKLVDARDLKSLG